MKTHNLVIYHCLACGAVMHNEPDQDVPQCCERPMIKAATETVGNAEDQLPDEQVQPPGETHPPIGCVQQTPS